MEDKKFQPYVPADKVMPEFTAVSILLGALLAIIFGGANAYLGLRVGMTVSASIPAAVISMGVIWKAMLSQMMTGYLPYWIDPKIYVEMFAAGILCYGVVAALELKRIGKVPMDMALKNVE